MAFYMELIRMISNSNKNHWDEFSTIFCIKLCRGGGVTLTLPDVATRLIFRCTANRSRAEQAQDRLSRTP